MTIKDVVIKYLQDGVDALDDVSDRVMPWDDDQTNKERYLVERRQLAGIVDALRAGRLTVEGEIDDQRGS